MGQPANMIGLEPNRSTSAPESGEHTIKVKAGSRVANVTESADIPSEVRIGLKRR